MTDVQKTFIKLVKMGLTGENQDIPDGTDWGKMYEMAQAHSVSTLLYYAVLNGKLTLSEEDHGLIKNQFYSSVTQLYNQKHYAKILFDELDKRSISYVELKGQTVRDTYPCEEMRTSCDIDIFYDTKYKDELCRIMEDMNFIYEGKGENHDSYINNTTLIELHYELTAPNAFLRDYYKNVWDKLIPSEGSRYVFSPEDNYIYIMIHFVKHFFSGGGGIRQLADINMYLKKYTGMDRKYLNEEFEKLGLLKFVSIIESIANKFLGDAAFTPEEEKTFEFLMAGNTYGFKATSAAVRFGEKSAKTAKIRFLWYRFFPPIEKMHNLYPILQKRAYFLPLFYVVRWFEVLLKRRNNISAVFKTVSAASKDPKAMEVMNIVDLNGKAARFF